MAKSASAKKHNAGQGKTKPANQLRSVLAINAAISLLVVIGCFVFLAAVEQPSINRDNIEIQVQNLANNQASMLDQALTQLRQRMAHMASTAPLLAALNNNKADAIAQFQLELTRAFPEAVTAKLIPLGPLGIAALDATKYGLRNNIELDLLRHASDGEIVEPDAYQYKGHWLFSLAEPIESSGAKFASGAILITLDQSYLSNLLSQLDSSLGQTTLIQQFKDEQHIIATTGNPGDKNYRITTESNRSQWQIAYEPSAELLAKCTHGALPIWILMGVATAAIIIATLIAMALLQKALLTNLSGLTSNGKSTFTLPGFAAVSHQIRTRLADAAKAAKAAATPGPEPAEEAKPTQLQEAPEPKSENVELPADIPEMIFRAYDIRGLAVQQLTDPVVFALGLAIGSAALDQGQQTLVVAADGRNSSPRIRDTLVKGLLASGRDVIDIGIVPTPLMYFATHQLNTRSGVMITGSHNPPEYNGIKIVLGGHALSGAAILALRTRILNKELSSGQGQSQTQAIDQAYIDYIINDVAIAQPLKIVIDAGNGVAGAIAPRLFEELGCDITPLYCEVDGNFPNHHPDPTVEENLSDLKQVVQQQQADLGIAFDGDGDRLGVVTASGKTVPADRLLMLLAQDVVSRNPGADILFDVKCTRNLNALISNYGGRPIMWKTGHSFMKEKMAETGALLGGEFSGHIFFKERWFGFDDGMYAAARLIEILSTTDPDLDLQLQAFPESIGSPELKVETTEEAKFSIIEQLSSQGQFGDGKISTLDGIRVDFSDGWGLVRASNTTPMLILRFEADSNEAMKRIKTLFKEQLHGVDPDLQFGF